MSSKETEKTSLVEVCLKDDIAVIQFPKKVFQKKEAKEFNAIIESIKEQKYPSIALNLSDCEYVSSEGLGVTAKLWRWCHDEGNGKMAVVLSEDTDNEVRNLFEIIGLARIIGSAIQPSIKDVLNYLKNF
ncbi:MAG: hypothetical protein GF401_04415 [Chitinivibrionales bacterium]|nr:hypothetical protein [Chitinivibrionales bacterium]